jgi:hypothetical protein
MGMAALSLYYDTGVKRGAGLIAAQARLPQIRPLIKSSNFATRLRRCRNTEHSYTNRARRIRWDDPFLLDEQLTKQRMVRSTARAYAQDKLLPRITKDYLEKTDHEIFNEMGDQPDRHHPAGGIWMRQCSYVAYGLVAREIRHVDSIAR